MAEEDSCEEELQKLMTTCTSSHEFPQDLSAPEKTTTVEKSPITPTQKSTREKTTERSPKGKVSANTLRRVARVLKEDTLEGAPAVLAKVKESKNWGETLGENSNSRNTSEGESSEGDDNVQEVPSKETMGLSRRPLSDTEQLETMMRETKQDLNKKVHDLGIHDEIEEHSDENVKFEEEGGEEGEQEEGEEDDEEGSWKNRVSDASTDDSQGSQECDDSTSGSPAGDDMMPKPKWHPPWQLKQEIVAHEAAIPVLVIDPTNRWFATGSSDNLIRIWDIDNYRLKLMIKAHKQSIRSMTFGMARHRYLYSTGDDRQLLCHDVEVNRVISKYKGQSTVIYCMCMYASSNLLVTGARDKYIKLFDTRTTKCIKSLRGHQNTVSCVLSVNNTPQIISGSHDGTLRVWDVGEGKCTSVLYGHSKSIRTMCQHPVENSILSASSERILAWDIETTEVVQEIPARDIAINSITINRLGVTVAGGSNGVMHLWDYPSGFRFQKIHRNKVYESQEIPICVFATKFDLSGTKLICSGACNVVKIYQEAFTRYRPYVDRTGMIHSESSLRKGTSTPNPVGRVNETSWR